MSESGESAERKYEKGGMFANESGVEALHWQRGQVEVYKLDVSKKGSQLLESVVRKVEQLQE